MEPSSAVLGSPCWRFNTLVNDISYISFKYHGSPNGEPTVSGEQRSFNSVLWISKWRTNCYKETKQHQVLHDGDPTQNIFISFYCLGSPNGEPSVSGESKALGSPLWRSINLVNNILYFILVSWISKWRTNCFNGTKTIQFQIMDLQMENQLLQRNLAVSGSSCWRSNTIVNIYHFRIIDLQMENQLLQGNQAAIGSPCWRSNCLVNDVSYILFLYHGSPNGDPTVSGEQRSFNFVS